MAASTSPVQGNPLPSTPAPTPAPISPAKEAALKFAAGIATACPLGDVQ